MKKSRVAISTMLASMLMVVSACSSSSTTSSTASPAASTAPAATVAATPTPAPAKEVKLTYATFIGDGDKDMMGIVIKEFMKQHPNVKIETQVFDHDAYQDKLAIMAKSNTLPDLFWWNATLITDAYNQSKSVADLTPYYDDAFKASLTPAALVNLTTADKKIVGFPAEMQVQAWLHNKALFDKFGVKIPTTFDELKAAVQVFKKNDVVTIAEGTKDDWPTWGFEDWLTKWGIHDNAKALFETGTMKYSESPVVGAYNAIGELAALGAFPDHNSTMNFEQAVALFTSGKAAMISIPSDQLGKVVGTPVEKDTEFTWGITFPDSKSDQKRVPGGVTNGYAVSANTAKDKDKMDAIVALNKFRFTEQGFKLSLQAGANLPGTVKADLSSYGKIIQDQAKLIADPNAHIDLTADYSFHLIWDANWEAYGSKFGTPKNDLINALINGSKKTADIPAEMKKLDKIKDDTMKNWQAHKK
ncbi:hypothetical protein A8709_15190 [Paenibacillus pectinilyticus]|uniref:ABC transporter substrate-binding protein n=1 Tax=Paenibacillus pectinilyticus TaxID=512399 RepID=A0A1C1A4E1_9BACL|nr:extracellular solute-binding protein [Paenibacillus pectinilyticus]OCT15423.1 hypothetical protein A8709_15190 [Paenibacillus pectinilyticus]